MDLLKKKIRNLFKDSTRTIAWLGLIVALVGGTPGFIALKNELYKARVDISYDSERVTLVGLVSDRKERSGKQAVLFYTLRFVGSGDFPLAVKKLQFYAKVGWWKWIEGKPINLHTNTINGRPNELVFANTKDKFVVQWDNFKEYSSDYYIERGKTVSFDAAFMFDKSEIDNSHKWEFVVIDFTDKKYKTTVQSPRYSSFREKNVYLFDCYLGRPEDIDELLKKKILSYQGIQTFMKSKYNHKPEWYD